MTEATDGDLVRPPAVGALGTALPAPPLARPRQHWPGSSPTVNAVTNTAAARTSTLFFFISDFRRKGEREGHPGASDERSLRHRLGQRQD